MEHIDGTVRLPGGWGPAPGDELRVTLEDVSRADVASTVLAEHRTALGRDAVQRFSLTYDASTVDPRARLAVRAQGLRADALVLTSTQHIPAPAEGGAVEVALSEVGAARVTGATESVLVGSWEVREIKGSEVEPGLRGAPLTITFHGGAVTGFAGCNTFRAPCRTDGQQLELGTIVATRRACVAGMDQEHRLLLALERATGFERHGPRLELTDPDGRVLLQLAWMPTTRSG